MIKNAVRSIPIRARWKLVLKTLPLVFLVILFKFFIHYLGYEFLTLNALFTAVISANIFLIGFLISGVLGDYKESERIPGDMASGIATMADEGLILLKSKNTKEAKAYLLHLNDFSKSLINWFYKKEKTKKLMEQLTAFNDHLLAFEQQTQANFIVRLKQEQNQLRRLINRVHTIRETSFLGTGYAIVEVITFILTLGLIFIELEPFYEGVFFVSFISFVTTYMIFFIKDLDNPFGYSQEDSLVEEVSLKPILETQLRIEEYCQKMK